MTAEVAVLNANAVALAADSVVTVSGSGGGKTYSTANKLFALSKYEPIGVMVYGASTLIGVPWELIVKTFRAELGEESHDTVFEYGTALFKWVARASDLLSDRRQIDAFRASVATFLDFFVVDVVKEKVRDELDSVGVK